MKKILKSTGPVKVSPFGGGLIGAVKKIMGLIWMLLAPVIIIYLVKSAVLNINSGGTRDINQPVPWIIIIAIFTPVAIGLMIFGYYALKGEYNHLPESSEDI